MNMGDRKILTLVTGSKGANFDAIGDGYTMKAIP